MKILKNEDWLSVILAFAIIGAVVAGIITRVPW